MGIPVRADIRVRLHDQSERGFRHAMVTVGRGGRAALAAGQRGATGDALDLLRLTDRSVILDVVQRDGRAQALALAHAQVDFLHAHLLAVADGGRGDPVARVIVDERQTVHLADDQIARVLASHSRSIIQSALHECLSGVLVRHATLAAVGFPLAPRGRSSRIVHAEKQIVVALHEDRRREIADTLLVWGLADITRKLEYDLLAQVAAQCRAVGVPHLERPTGGAPVAAATIDQRAQYGLQVGSEAVVKRVFLRPCRAARVLRGVEAERQAGGHAATRLVLVQQGLEDRTRIRTVKRPFALVVAVREQMGGIIVLRLAQEPADRLAGIGDGLGTVVGLAAAPSDDIASVVRLAIAGAIRHLHGHFEAVGKLSVECLRVTGQHRILDADRTIIIVEHRSAEAHRLRQYADTRAERPVGHETSMQRLSHD